MTTRGIVKEHSILRTVVSPLVCFAAAALFALGQTNEVEKAMVTDSDGDGMTDWDEWQAGTNPGDPSNCFTISTASMENGEIVLTWKSIGTRTYQVVSATAVTGLAFGPQHVTFVKATGGMAPWYETSSTVTNLGTTSNSFFRVQLVASEDFDQATLDMATLE